MVPTKMGWTNGWMDGQGASSIQPHSPNAFGGYFRLFIVATG